MTSNINAYFWSIPTTRSSTVIAIPRSPIRSVIATAIGSHPKSSTVVTVAVHYNNFCGGFNYHSRFYRNCYNSCCSCSCNRLFNSAVGFVFSFEARLRQSGVVCLSCSSVRINRFWLARRVTSFRRVTNQCSATETPNIDNYLAFRKLKICRTLGAHDGCSLSH